VLRIGAIARRAETAKRFPVHLLPEIRNAGQIAGIGGRNGGFRRIKAPAAISAKRPSGDDRRADPRLMCRSRRARQRRDGCADEATCRIRTVFAGAFRSCLVLTQSLTPAGLPDQPAAAQQGLSAAPA
jgi:DNA-binding IscR family transcriptional regulator